MSVLLNITREVPLLNILTNIKSAARLIRHSPKKKIGGSIVNKVVQLCSFRARGEPPPPPCHTFLKILKSY